MIIYEIYSGIINEIAILLMIRLSSSQKPYRMGDIEAGVRQIEATDVPSTELYHLWRLTRIFTNSRYFVRNKKARIIVPAPSSRPA